jgi:hypothetical protein
MSAVVRVFLFVVFSVVYSFVFMMAFVIVNPAPSQLSALLVLAGSMTVSALMVFVLPRLTAKKKQRQAAEKLDELTAATRGYIEDLEQRRVFAPVTVPGLHLEEGEFAVRHERTALAEYTRARVGGGLGTRVRVGGFPIYLGGWKSVPKEELRETGTGELVLTNRRLLFLGARTLTIPFDKLLTCQQIGDGLVVSESRSKHPHVLVVENPGLWCFLVNWVADNRFTDPKLPDGMHLSVTGESPNFQVHVTGRGILGTLKHRNTIIHFD